MLVDLEGLPHFTSVGVVLAGQDLDLVKGAGVVGFSEVLPDGRVRVLAIRVLLVSGTKGMGGLSHIGLGALITQNLVHYSTLFTVVSLVLRFDK